MTNQIRNPKSEIRPAATARQRGESKPEARNPNRSLAGFGSTRSSEFGFLSDFEFRNSDFRFDSSFVIRHSSLTSAFTLIELVISAALMSLILAAAYLCLNAALSGQKL